MVFRFWASMIVGLWGQRSGTGVCRQGRVVGQSAPGQTFATKAEAYENYKPAAHAMEHQLGRSTCGLARPSPWVSPRGQVGAEGY